jgi:NADH-quinone oxidoreductase subunit J
VLYLLLSAEFVAAAQVLVYAGAVMVMFLFVIATSATGRRALGRRAELAGVGAVAAAAALLVEVIVVIGLKTSGRSRRGRRSGRFGSPPRSAASS